jgi:WD40 repeat protein
MMSEENRERSRGPTDSDRVPSAVQQLWEHWRQQQRPDFATFPPGEPLTAEQILALVRFDQHDHWRNGQRVPAEMYLQRYPMLREDAELTLVMIFSEFLIRCELGERPDLEEYCYRFPALAENLRRQHALNLAFLPASKNGTAEQSGRATLPGKAAPRVPAPAGYDILGELGRGGMGVVYKARQTGLNRLVALKMLLAGDYAGAEQQRRFESEAQAVAQLRHPNFVQVHDYGDLNGNAYLALEFIEGGTLAQKAGGRPLSVPDAAQMVETLAAAMHHAHCQNLVHRDLKPANVLLTTDGVLKITDFGLVKRLDDSTLDTKSGTVVGTASYMAPEQVTGNARAIGPATDVYALGVILYELLTGRPPFQGENALQVFQQVKEQEPLPPSRLQPRMPRDVETICLKCLQKEPGQRYPTAAALAEDLRRFRAGEPIGARPVAALERSWRWCRRNPRWAATFAAMAGLLSVIAVGASALSLGLNRALQQAERANHERQVKLFETYLEKARAMRNSRRTGQRFGTLQTIAQAVQLARELDLPADRFRELSTQAIAALALTDLQMAREWEGKPEGTLAVDFDGSFERYARVGPEGNVTIRCIRDDTELWSLPGFGADSAKSIFELLFSPDGNYLLLWAAPGRSKLWKLDARGPILSRQDATGPVVSHTFSADSRRLAFGHPDGSIELVDLLLGDTKWLPAEDGRRAIAHKGLALHPEAKSIALITRVEGQPVVQVRDLDRNRVVATLRPRGPVENLTWHPGGRLLAASARHAIYLWDIEDGTVVELEGTRNGGLQLAFNHRGDLLASCDWNGEVRLWETHSAQLLFSTYANFKTVRFSQDDRLLGGDVWNTQHLRVWEVASRRAYYSLRRHAPANGDIYAKPAISPDGRWLAVGMYDGVRVWDLATGHEQAHLDRNGRTIGLLFDADNALWTYGSLGLLRWPIRTASLPERCRIGPPRALLASGIEHSSLCGDRDGQIFAVSQNEASVAVVQVTAPAKPVQQLANISSVCVSADGQHIALTTWDTTGPIVRVSEAYSARLIREWRTDKPQVVLGFAPDGRWLVVSDVGLSRGCLRLWRIDSAEQGVTLKGKSTAFSPDGSVLAIDTGEGAIRLVKAGTDQEYACLDDPQQNLPFDVPGGMVFTSDGGQLLIVSNTGMPAVHVWDLQFLRQELATLGLDNHLPLGAPSAKDREAAAPKALPRWELDTSGVPLAPAPALALFSTAIALQPFNPAAYYQRALAYTALERYPEAVADSHRAVDLHADWQTLIVQTAARPLDLNNLAWAYMAKPPLSHGAQLAVALAKRAVELDGLNGSYRNTLGIAYYRDGRYRRALAVLTENLHGEASRYDAYDLYFLAMSYHRLEEPAKAKECFERACSSHQRNAGILAKQQVEELNQFRTEAETTLGLGRNLRPLR